MTTRTSIDVLVVGAGPGALAIAAALGKEMLRVEVLLFLIFSGFL